MNKATSASAPADAWRSTVTVRDVARRCKAARSVALLTHIKPDGDAIGSTLAVARALRHAGVAATCCYLPPWPERFGEVLRGTPTLHLPEANPASGLRPEPDLALVLDTGAWSQLTGLEEWLRARRDRVIVIDHHLHGDAEISESRIIEPGAAAACEIVAGLCVAILGVADASGLPEDVAEALYMGLATDTGWFHHSNTSPTTLRLAAWLLEAGVRHDRLFALVEQSDSEARLRLMARALASVEFHAGGRVALMTLRGADFEACGAEPGDSSGFVETPLHVAGVRISAILTETDRGACKLSMRSKPGPGPGDEAVDVHEIGKGFGGGGHARAAGARFRMPLRDALPVVLDALTRAVE
jgi:phosphoesterase RecJ-like protein